MTNRKPAEVTALVVNALTMAKRRGVLLAGWSGLDGVALPDSIIQVDSVPHDWLFPQMAAVVHHSGNNGRGFARRYSIRHHAVFG